MSGVFDSIIPKIQNFLNVDLRRVSLPPDVEAKRLALLERIEILSLGPIPPIPETSGATVSIPQRRPLSSVVRFFASKRYSLPPSISCSQINPVVTTNNVPTLNSSLTLVQHSSNNDPPPLPPKANSTCFHEQTIFENPYETPRKIVDAAFRRSPASSGDRSKSSINQSTELQSSFGQLSQSPHLSNQDQIISSSPNSLGINQTHLIDPNPFFSPTDSSTGPVTELVDGTLILPKKCLTSQVRRFSAHIDPSDWTLIGSLSHRYKPNKWTHLSLCLLTSGSRLLAYKSGHSLTPSLTLFLCGSSGIYSGRDSGMNYVIKIAHPTRGTTVLAAETEQQALIWVRQINQYSQGITPTEIYSFLQQPTVVNPIKNQHQSVETNSILNGLVTQDFPSGSNHENHTFLDLQVDSGFSAPISSGSENNSGDGMIPCFTGTDLPSTATVLTTDSQLIAKNYSPISEYCNQTKVTSPSRPLSVALTPTYGDTKKTSRRNSLLSSMRRKVESFSSKRRARKSHPLASQLLNEEERCSSFLPPHKSHRRRASDGHWINNSIPLSQSISEKYTTLHPPPAATWVSDRSGQLSGRGFSWAQLESAGGRFLNQQVSTISPPRSVQIQLNTNSFCRKKTNRPMSLVADGSNVFRGPVQLSMQKQSGTLLDLHHFESECTINSDLSPISDNQIIIAGQACISIPGHVPWTTRWCCLRSHCLDIYSTITNPEQLSNKNSGGDLFSSPTCWPLFSLVLEPGKVELGLAGDKRHSSAVRLAVPTQSSTPLLFDVPDKLQMGAWIRGFIQALGIIPMSTDSRENIKWPSDARNSRLLSSTRKSPSPQNRINDHSPSGNGIGSHLVFPIMETSQYSQNYSEVLDKAPIRDLREECSCTIGGIIIYDEVCPSQSNSTHSKSDCRLVASSKRCWSSPHLVTEHYTRTNYRVDSDSLCPRSSQNPRWCIPPPSRRLLAQPLPPLPSIGPSGCESMVGTMASSYASSNLTPDEMYGSAPKEDLNSVLSEPELYNIHTHSLQSHPSNQPSSSKSDRHSMIITGIDCWGTSHQSRLSGQSTVPNSTCSDLTLIPNATSCMHNSISTFTTVNTSNGSVATITDCCTTSSTAIQTPNSNCWYVQSHDALPSSDHSLVEDTKTSKVLTARRCVSCLSGNKPMMIPANLILSHSKPNSISTLPGHHLCTNYSLNDYCSCEEVGPGTFTSPTNNAMMMAMAMMNWNQASFSSNSSRTATSSGIALTTGSSCSPPASGCTTRPPSMTVTWIPVATVREEENQRSCERLIEQQTQTCQMPIINNVSKENCDCCKRTANHLVDEFSQYEQVTSKMPPKSLSNTSLILVATQLEEVQQETKSLRFRRKSLSSRLSGLLNNLSHDDHVCNQKQTVSLSEPDSSCIHTSEVDKCSNDTVTNVAEEQLEEATASLCARLAAVELLLKHAETTEAHLRKEFGSLLSNDSCGMLDNQIKSTEVVCLEKPTSADFERTSTVDTTKINSSPCDPISHRKRRGPQKGVSSNVSNAVPDPNGFPHTRGRGRGSNNRTRHHNRRRLQPDSLKHTTSVNQANNINSSNPISSM